MFTEAHAEEYLRTALRKRPPTLWIFDFDDTLVFTDCKVKVTDRDGTVTMLTPAQFAVYLPTEDDVFEYDEFFRLINPRPVTWMLMIMSELHKQRGANSVAVLSARSTPDPIIEFLSGVGMPDVVAHACRSADPARKVEWVRQRINEGKRVEFFDDSRRNADMVSKLPGVKSYCVKHL